MLMTATDVASAAELADWLEAHGYATAPVDAPDAMGSGETIALVTAGAATVRGALLVVREWIRAHRTDITLEVPERGSFHVSGPAEIDALIALIDAPREDA